MYRQPPSFDDPAAERLDRKQRLAVAFRVFARLGYDEGAAGHITVRDPERPDHYWVNPAVKDFSSIRTSDLVLVNHAGELVEGEYLVNNAALAIHSAVHGARPDVIAAAHSHSVYGKAWSTLRRPLDPLTQDACAFYQDHGIHERFSGVVLDAEEGAALVRALGPHKALILANHGLLTAGGSVDAAAYWFIAMDRACQTQLAAEAAGDPLPIPHEIAKHTHDQTGQDIVGFLSFQPWYERIVAAEPDVLD
jgi:ribulose-5-phosphate 4-epimerase/fuculose-1-phosphate aldolase